jgi:hypothetical protein
MLLDSGATWTNSSRPTRDDRHRALLVIRSTTTIQAFRPSSTESDVWCGDTFHIFGARVARRHKHVGGDRRRRGNVSGRLRSISR